MSNKKEIAKLAREIKQIKAQFNKESGGYSNVLSEMVANLFPDPNQVSFITVGKNWIILKFKDRGEVTNIKADFIKGRGILNVHASKVGEVDLSEGSFEVTPVIQLDLNKETKSSAQRKIMSFLTRISLGKLK